MIDIQVLCQEITKVKSDLAIITFCKDIIPFKGDTGDIDWVLSAQISKLVKNEKIFGTYKETTLLNSRNKIPSEKILIFGLGKSSNLGPSKIEKAYGNILNIVTKLNINNFCFGVRIKELSSVSYQKLAECMIKGILNELIKAKKQKDYSMKIIEKDKNKIGLLKKIVKENIKKYKNNLHKIETF